MRNFCVRKGLVGSFLTILVAAGCGDGGNGGEALSPDPVAGTAAVFDLDADLSVSSTFFDLPYPSDLRLDGDGRADHSGFPGRANRILRSVVTAANERRYWPVTPFAYFRFDAPLASQSPDLWFPAHRESSVLLIGVGRDDRDFGKILPAVASTLPSDSYTPANLLAVSVPPGVVLDPSSTYAFVVQRHLKDASGAPLGVGAVFAALRAGQVPPGERGAVAAEQYAPLWEALDRAGIDRADVAAATIFTTADAVGDLERLSDRIREEFPVEISNLRIDPDDGATHARFCELHGEARVKLFQRGDLPYNNDGRFVYDGSGLPIPQAEQRVPITVTLPRAGMPADGYPTVLYFHGTGGDSQQVVDRGAVREAGGMRTKGEGPAHVLAEHGFATFAAALPLNPERYDGPAGVTERSYLNLTNLGAYPDTFRQMAIEQRLFLDALARLEIPRSVTAACGLPAASNDHYRLRTERAFVLGQSLGGQIVNMVGALDPRVAAVVPTGSGGHWSLTIVSAEFAPGVPAAPLVELLLGVAEIRDHLHPALQLVQSVFEPAEPLVYARRLAVDPLPDHPARSIYQPVGIDDPGFPNAIYAAMALASGTQQAGEVLHPSLERALALEEREGIASYPVAENQRSRNGRRYTGAAVQYFDDGILDAHHIFAQLDDVKSQYGCFLRSVRDGGEGMVSAPAPLDGACP